jgi:hypothetical protein
LLIVVIEEWFGLPNVAEDAANYDLCKVASYPAGPLTADGQKSQPVAQKITIINKKFRPSIRSKFRAGSTPFESLHRM